MLNFFCIGSSVRILERRLASVALTFGAFERLVLRASEWLVTFVGLRSATSVVPSVWSSPFRLLLC